MGMCDLCNTIVLIIDRWYDEVENVIRAYLDPYSWGHQDLGTELSSRTRKRINIHENTLQKTSGNKGTGRKRE